MKNKDLLKKLIILIVVLFFGIFFILFISFQNREEVNKINLIKERINSQDLFETEKYLNEFFGFKFEYPIGSLISDTKDINNNFVINITHPDSGGFEPVQVVIRKIPDQYSSIDSEDYKELDYFELLEGDYSAIKIKRSGQEIYSICFNQNQTYIPINQVEIFCNKIIFSFDFLSQEEWQEIEKAKKEIKKKFSIDSNATNIKVEYGDFNGNQKMDAILYYELFKKQYLEIYLWNDETGKYSKDERNYLNDILIEKIQIIDLNQNGKEEIFIVDGNKYYLIAYQDKGMNIIPINREIKNQKWREIYGKDGLNYGSERIFIEDGILQRNIYNSIKNSINIKFKLENGMLVAESERAIFNDYHLSYFSLELPAGWVEVEEDDYYRSYEDDKGNYFYVPFIDLEKEISSDMIWYYGLDDNFGAKIVKENPRCESGKNCLRGDEKFKLVLLPEKSILDGPSSHDAWIYLYLGNKEGEEIDLEFFREILKGFKTHMGYRYYNNDILINK